MKAFRLFDSVRKALRDDAIVLLPDGPGSDAKHVQIGSGKNDFYGRIARTLYTDELLAACTNLRVDYAMLEMLCREPVHASFMPALVAIAEAYWGYTMAHKQVMPTESTFFLLYAMQTLACEGKPFDMATYDTGVAFGLYCLDRATEETS